MILPWLLFLLCPSYTDGETDTSLGLQGNVTETAPIVNGSESDQTGTETFSVTTQKPASSLELGDVSSRENRSESVNQTSTDSPGKNNTESVGKNATELSSQTHEESKGQASTEETKQTSVEPLVQNITESTGQNSTSSSNTTDELSTDDSLIDEENGTTSIQPEDKLSTNVLNETDTVDETMAGETDNSTVESPGKTATELEHKNTNNLITTTEGFVHDLSWMKMFLTIKHFDGWYIYGGGRYVFDFVARFVHPTSSQTLVATFYDEDGAVLDMNGTSEDGQTVTFTSTLVYSGSYRFSKDMVLQLNGSLTNKGDKSVYSGMITLPQNSSFGKFHMKKGPVTRESADLKTSKTAAIIAVVACISFLFILGTTSFVCWAMRKGYLRKQHKHYRLFTDSAVAYETDAETVHI